MVYLQTCGFKPFKKWFPLKTPLLVSACVSFSDKPTLPFSNECYLSTVSLRLLVTKLILVHLPKCHNVHQNLAVASPILHCSPCIFFFFLSVSVRDPGFKLSEVQMTSGFPVPPEYWLQRLSVHYSSKLMMQGTTCCLQLSV